MEIKSNVNGEETVMELSGWLDTQTAPEFKEAIDGIDNTTSSLVLDLKDLEYISSAGLRQLVAAHKKMKGNLTICNVSKEILDILRMAGFDKRLNIK
ncbi:MAG: STAS domain-containing protein [Lachnospiraceae bacterium]|nr:STAS domain-containing protein [Lachnospiraceae bacterium]